jgi:hypothetical protein
MPRKLVPQRHVVGSFAASQATASIVAAWRRILADDDLRASLELPGRLLSEYFRERHRSRLGKLFTACKRLAESCDPVVLVGPKCAVAGAEALFAATTHPYYNRLAHGGRGGRPRLVFVEPTLDNDRLQAALDLLKSADDAHAPGEHWGLIAIDAEADDVRAVKDVFGASLDESRVVLLPDSGGKSRYFGELSLAAATLVGADVVTLLKGAAWFHEAARQAPAEKSEAVLLASFLAAGPTQLVAWHHAPEALARRFDAHVAVVAGCDPAARRALLNDATHGRVHLFTDVVRRDRLPAAATLAAAYREVRDAETAAGTPSCEIRLARLNDHAIGELCAWFEAARLIGKLAQPEA